MYSNKLQVKFGLASKVIVIKLVFNCQALTNCGERERGVFGEMGMCVYKREEENDDISNSE